jgi:hypothetical protein
MKFEEHPHAGEGDRPTGKDLYVPSVAFLLQSSHLSGARFGERMQISDGTVLQGGAMK